MALPSAPPPAFAPPPPELKVSPLYSCLGAGIVCVIVTIIMIIDAEFWTKRLAEERKLKLGKKKDACKHDRAKAGLARLGALTGYNNNGIGDGFEQMDSHRPQAVRSRLVKFLSGRISHQASTSERSERWNDDAAPDPRQTETPPADTPASSGRVRFSSNREDNEPASPPPKLDKLSSALKSSDMVATASGQQQVSATRVRVSSDALASAERSDTQPSSAQGPRFECDVTKE